MPKHDERLEAKPSAKNPAPRADALKRAREFLATAESATSLSSRMRAATAIAELWVGQPSEQHGELAEVYARALVKVAARAEDAGVALGVAGRIGGLLAIEGLASPALAEAYAQATVYAAIVAREPWQRLQCAAQIEDLLDEGAPFDSGAVALCFGRAVHALVLLESKSPQAEAFVKSLEAMVLGRHPGGSKLQSPALGYELVKVVLMRALDLGSEVSRGHEDFVRRLVRATNTQPEAEFDDWLSSFAAGDHRLSDFAIELLGLYREVRWRASGATSERFGFRR